MELRKAVDNLNLYDPQFETEAIRTGEAMGGSTANHAITSLPDIKNATKAYTNVKFLMFNTHGVPGGIVLPNGLAYSMEFIDMNDVPNLLSKDARILFLGCNVGQDEVGDKFMDKAGGYLLKGKGGFIGATTVANFTLGWLVPEATMWGLTNSARLKVRKYDVSGQLILSREVSREPKMY